MMKSMTGFGRASGGCVAALPAGFRAEVSSVNRRQFEMKFVMPREISCYEASLRSALTPLVSRGAVTVRVDLVRQEGGSSSSLRPRINKTLVKELLSDAEALQSELALPGKLTISDVLSLPGVVEISEMDFTLPCVEESLRRVVLEAAENMLKHRETEGANLKADMEKRLRFLEEILEEIIPLAARIPALQQERLLQRVRESGMAADPQDERFLRELVIFSDRADVTEEITRLKSHFSHFSALMETSSEPVGRTLDFMVQEMFREINTLGNKALSIEISPRIVSMKTELEKIREQVQNIE